MSKLSSNAQRLRATRARLRGVSLIELMVALVISLVLIAGAIQVYVFSRQNYDVNEEVVRMQEVARYAFSVLEPDIRMANSWGLVKGFIESDVIYDTNCGANLAGNLAAPLDGTNNKYLFTCNAYGTGAIGSADTLIVRRASTFPGTPSKGRLQVCSSRTTALLVADSTTCGAPPTDQINNLLVNAYYIDRDSEHRAGVPALRRLGLPEKVGDDMVDEEIVPGVEDLQIQFGIDPSGGKGMATRYVNPGTALPADAQVVSVRLWVLVRAENEDRDFRGGQPPYEYGDRSIVNGTISDLNSAAAGTRAYAPNDRFRRLLVSKTIQIRNSMGL